MPLPGMRVLLIVLFALPLFAQMPAAEAGPCPPQWGYGARYGPDQWGQMTPEFADCDTYMWQSPIDLSGVPEDSRLPEVTVDYLGPFAVTIQNTSHEIKVWPLEQRVIGLAGVPYRLVQFHFHNKVEHTGTGAERVAEMHLVHQSISGRAQSLAIAVFLTPGAKNDALDTILTNKPPSCTSKKIDSLNLMQLIPPGSAQKAYYVYSGSLTTPPCSKDIQFLIYDTPVQASREQIEALKLTADGNVRPPQPRARRDVKKRPAR